MDSINTVISLFGFLLKHFLQSLTSIKKTSHDINQFRYVLKSILLINLFYSVETTNKMQPCNRIYYSTVH